MTHTDVFIVLDRERRVLLIDGALPQQTHDFHFWQACAEANCALKTAFGIEAITIRVTQTEWGDDTRFTYLMQYRGGDLPPNAAWTFPDRASPAAQVALSWLVTDHSHRVPWYRPDFFDQITQTMHDRFGTVTHLEQVRSWGRSSIWRLQTTDTTAYLKLVPPMFAHEPQLSAWLAQAFPQSVPAIMAVEPEQWLVMADYGGESLFAEIKRDIALWERALREYARFQQATRAAGPQLVADTGLPIRDLRWIEARWRALLSDDAALNRGSRPLTAEERDQIVAALPEIESALKVLRAQELMTLTHGDFWAGQIVQTADDRLLFTDWSDAALAHPFFDVAFFLAAISGDLPAVPDAKDRLVAAYLSEWGEFGSVEAYAAAEIVAPLYTALRYHHDTLPRMEIAWEMENMLNYNVRLMLKACAQQP
ncbi:MAG: aminoglycoside phosphotransferase family protein [Anaerolineae bacterium]|nr:aminoglycoside phosphotransferase family protein [Anaerolineae bacterium]